MMKKEFLPHARHWDEANSLLKQFDNMLKEETCTLPEKDEELHIGVDLGTSSILTVVLGKDMRPLAGLMEYATVVKDGVILDFRNARNIVIKQKERLEQSLGVEFTHAAAAIPPGVSDGNVRAVKHVLEGAGYECTAICDESTAAAIVLGVSDGAVVDIGGGTTGISILADGRVICSEDEATGGHHITLVLSGGLGMPYDVAEQTKRDVSRHSEVYPIVRPVVEKMASITAHCISGREVSEVYVVGGACAFDKFSDSFNEVLDLPVFKPECPWLVTPIGIAMHDMTV